MTHNKIFITGGTGKIGHFLVSELLANSYALSLLCRNKTGVCNRAGIECIVGNLVAPDSYVKGLEGADVVVHLGGVAYSNYVSTYYKVNADATLRLVKLCESSRVKKLIFISTNAVSEQGGHYSRSKLMAEECVQKSSLNWVIVRLAEVYGIYGNTGINMIIKNINRLPFIPIIGSGEYVITPVHISDVIFSIRQAIEREDITRKIYTIAGPESFTFNQFIDHLLKIQGLKKKKISIPVSCVSVILRVLALLRINTFFVMDQIPRLLVKKSNDISLAKNDFGFKPVTVRTALKNSKS
jgi:nucleoside-diphosphate-sugar epimerase